jgi:predicted transcriptional regulator
LITLVIQADEEMATALQQIAEQKATTVDAIAKEALRDYLRAQASPSRAYSFIGIGHSGKGNLSKQAEAILESAANRREGWSLPQ